jgi:hypothetical protein
MTVLKKTAAMVLLVFMSAGCAIVPQWTPSRTHWEGDRAELQIQQTHESWYIRVENGGAPYWINFDTGIWSLDVTEEWAKENGGTKLTALPMWTVDGGGHREIQGDYRRIPQLKIGGVTFQQFDVTIADIEHIYPARHHKLPVRGTMGITFLKDCLVTLDFAAGKIVLERGELPPANGVNILEFRNLFHEGIMVKSKLGGKDVWAKIDTGLDGELSASEDVVAGLKFTGPIVNTTHTTYFGESARRCQALDGDFVMGFIKIDQPEISVGGRRDRLLVGTRILNQFRITIDQKNNRIKFVRNI